MGSLSLYRRTGGHHGYLSHGEAVAARVAEQLLQAELLTSTDAEPVQAWMDGAASRRRRLVWQAQGLTVQANRITPSQAIDLLRAHAFTANRTLDDIAVDVVTGRLPVPVIRADC